MSSDYESEEDIPTYMLSVTWKVPVDPIETIARVENYFAINVRFTAYLVSVAKSPKLSRLPMEMLLMIKTHAIDLDYEPRVLQLGKEMLCKTGRCGVDGKAMSDQTLCATSHNIDDDASLTKYEHTKLLEWKERMGVCESHWYDPQKAMLLALHNARKSSLVRKLYSMKKNFKRLDLEVFWEGSSSWSRSLSLFITTKPLNIRKNNSMTMHDYRGWDREIDPAAIASLYKADWRNQAFHEKLNELGLSIVSSECSGDLLYEEWPKQVIRYHRCNVVEDEWRLNGEGYEDEDYWASPSLYEDRRFSKILSVNYKHPPVGGYGGVEDENEWPRLPSVSKS